MYAAYETLREANLARQGEWDPSDQITLAYAGNELAGEVGEAVDAAEMMDSSGVMQEVGDVIICCDLIAMRIGLDLDITVDLGDWYGGRYEAIAGLATATGGACNSIKKLERERFGLAGSRSTFAELIGHLREVVVNAHKLAHDLEAVDVGRAVADKFNMTSKKVGLNTRLLPPSEME